MEENRYKRGKIYKLVCNATGKQYIGSTTEPTLARRLAQHRGDFNKWKNGKKNRITSCDVLEKNDYQIVLIEDYPCERKEQLLMRERFHIESTECINKIIRPFRTETEKLEYHKQYMNKNKDEISKKHKIYYNLKTNKDKKKETDKTYYDKNRDKLLERSKQYLEANRELINEKRRLRRAELKEAKEKSQDT